jgi:5-methylcytosine-specific restriction endonuclease McrA
MPPKKRRKPPSKVTGLRHTRNRVYGSAWQKVRDQVMARDGGVCQIRSPVCRGRAQVVDHIQDWKLGGAWTDPANLRAACRACNAWRAAKGKGDTPGGATRAWPSAFELDGFAGGCASDQGGPHDLTRWGGPVRCWGQPGHASRDWGPV